MRCSWASTPIPTSQYDKPSVPPVERDRLYLLALGVDLIDAVHDGMLLGSRQCLESERAAKRSA